MTKTERRQVERAGAGGRPLSSDQLTIEVSDLRLLVGTVLSFKKHLP